MFCSSTLALQPAVEVSISLHKIRRSSEAERRPQSDWVPMCAGIIVFLFWIVSIVEHRRTLSPTLFEMKTNSGWWICSAAELCQKLLSELQCGSVDSSNTEKHSVWEKLQMVSVVNILLVQEDTIPPRCKVFYITVNEFTAYIAVSGKHPYREAENVNIIVMHQNVFFMGLFLLLHVFPFLEQLSGMAMKVL